MSWCLSRRRRRHAAAPATDARVNAQSGRTYTANPLATPAHTTPAHAPVIQLPCPRRGCCLHHAASAHSTIGDTHGCTSGAEPSTTKNAPPASKTADTAVATAWSPLLKLLSPRCHHASAKATAATTAMPFHNATSPSAPGSVAEWYPSNAVTYGVATWDNRRAAAQNQASTGDRAPCREVTGPTTNPSGPRKYASAPGQRPNREVNY